MKRQLQLTNMYYVFGKNNIAYGYELPIGVSPTAYYKDAIDVHSYKNGRRRPSAKDGKYYYTGEEQPIGDKKYFAFYQRANQKKDSDYGYLLTETEKKYSAYLKQIVKIEQRYKNILLDIIKRNYPNLDMSFSSLEDILSFLLNSETSSDGLIPPTIRFTWDGMTLDDFTFNAYVHNPSGSLITTSQNAVNEFNEHIANHITEYTERIKRAIQTSFEQFMKEQGFSEMHGAFPLTDEIVSTIFEGFFSKPEFQGWLAEIHASNSNWNLKDTKVKSADWDYHGVLLDHKLNLDDGFHIGSGVVQLFNKNSNKSTVHGRHVKDIIKELDDIISLKNVNQNWEKIDFYYINLILNLLLKYSFLVMKYGIGASRLPIFVSYKDNKWYIKLMSEILRENGLSLNRNDSDIFNFQEQIYINEYYNAVSDLRYVNLWYMKQDNPEVM